MTRQYTTKLIEVAMPLDAINTAAVREKNIRLGHPSTLHLWWARRPLAACRAVLFASLVDDPSSHPDRFPSEESQTAERARLFRILEQLVTWEATTDADVLEMASREIHRSCDGEPPTVLDPFSGGGSIALEAQRLGLEARGSDLNPLAVLIGRALFDIPPRFNGQAPVNQLHRTASATDDFAKAAGLAKDIQFYGERLRQLAFDQVGVHYPSVSLSAESGENVATVIAWIWARTVTCPNPACRASMPLASSFHLSKKRGKEAWLACVHRCGVAAR